MVLVKFLQDTMVVPPDSEVKSLNKLPGTRLLLFIIVLQCYTTVLN